MALGMAASGIAGVEASESELESESVLMLVESEEVDAAVSEPVLLLVRAVTVIRLSRMVGVSLSSLVACARKRVIKSTSLSVSSMVVVKRAKALEAG